MNFSLLKLSMFAALAAPLAVASSDESSLPYKCTWHSRCRFLSFPQVSYDVEAIVEATLNDERFHRNSIRCRGVKVNECKADGDFSQPFLCDDMDYLCCQLSNIKETTFDKYGKCKVMCIPDGSPVWMDLYESRLGPRVDTDVEDLCCSGVCDDCTETSSTGRRRDGRQWFEGSASGTCGAGEVTVKSS